MKEMYKIVFEQTTPAVRNPSFKIPNPVTMQCSPVKTIYIYHYTPAHIFHNYDYSRTLRMYLDKAWLKVA